MKSKNPVDPPTRTPETQQQKRKRRAAASRVRIARRTAQMVATGKFYDWEHNNESADD